MSSTRRLFLLTLIFGILIGLTSPAWVRAEKPTPTPEIPPTPENGSPSGVAPTFLTEHLLSDPVAPSGCTPVPYNFTNSDITPIPDANVMTSTIQVVGIEPYLWDVDLNIHIAHTYNGDLEIFLISPTGTEVTISTDNGGSNDNVFNGTHWDDQWVGDSVTDYPYVNDTLVPNMSPEEAMGAFIGENPNGTWQLVIRDDASLDTGTLSSWSLDFTTFPVAPIVINSYSTNSSLTVQIPDGDTVEIPLSFYFTGAISKLELDMNIEHTNSEDLELYLISPNGLITVTLTSDNGGTLNDLFEMTTWDDDAGDTNPPGAVTDMAFEDGVAEPALVPENAMAAFVGSSSGIWKLVIVDDAGGETGVLNGWEIRADVQSCLADVALRHGYASYTSPIGEPIDYAIEVRNNGPVVAHDLMMTDTLPTDMAFQSWISPPGWTCQTPAVGATGVVTCQIDALDPLTVVTHTLNLMPVDIPQPLLSNQVIITTSDPEFDPDNNESSYEKLAVYLSANGNFWDVQDDLNFWITNNNNLPMDDGAVNDSGQDAFDSWGALNLRVTDEANTILTDNAVLEDFDFAFTGEGWLSHKPQVYEGVSVSRAIDAPSTADYLRYLDTFTNTSDAVRKVYVAWGGNLGSDGWTTIAATSSGDLTIAADDQWAVTIQENSFNPAGPAYDPPVGYLLHGAGDTSYLGTGDDEVNPFDDPWTGNGNEDLAHVFAFTLQPGETAHLLYFVYRGLSETVGGPEGCVTDCVIPPAGSELALAQTTLLALAETPDVCGLSAEVRAHLINWPDLNVSCQYTVSLPIVVR